MKIETKRISSSGFVHVFFSGCKNIIGLKLTKSGDVYAMNMPRYSRDTKQLIYTIYRFVDWLQAGVK